MGWPQYIVLGITAINILGYAVLDGEPKTGSYKFSIGIISLAFTQGLLYWGGFYS